MKINEPVTQRDHPLSESDVIISTTTAKGVITSVNQEFIDIAGFTEAELLGQAHNMVRHPDMPQIAFKDLWDQIKQHKPWMGLVKNRCKNGDHYYVDAYVTPIYNNGQVDGFQSVRVKPDPVVVARAEAFYKAVRENKLRWWRHYSPANLSYRTKALLLAGLVSVPSIVAAGMGGNWWVAGITLVVATVFSLIMVQPLLSLAAKSKKIFDNPITQLVYTGRADELGQIELVIEAQRAQNRTILGRVKHASHSLSLVADETQSVVDKTRRGVDNQKAEVEQVATAMHEMTATVAEVARNAETTSQASHDVLYKTETGVKLVADTVEDIHELSNSVAHATTVIETLKNDSEKIGSVVDVISNIASETNLLALNAAIEAARAGEQGRGFAVVADEVRNLASNTQNSTDEIQQMIKRIQQTAIEAVAAMSAGRAFAEKGVEQIQRVGAAFDEITQGVGHISDLNTQVAAASEEQSMVSEEINRNVVNIMEGANSTHESAQDTASATAQLTALTHELELMVLQFGKV